MNQTLFATIEAAHAALIAEGRTDAVTDYFSADYRAHGTERDLVGPDAVRRYIESLRRAFPDLRADTEMLVENGDRVAWQRTFRGTHENAFMGFPSSGRELVWRDMITSRFQDGLITDDWVVTDLVERLLLARKR